MSESAVGLIVAVTRQYVGRSTDGALPPAVLVNGAVNLSTSTAARFGFTFCQSIGPTGAVGCEVDGLQAFDNDQPPNQSFTGGVPAYSHLFNLDFHVPFGIPYEGELHGHSLASGGAGRISSATADFSHTGTEQPAQVKPSSSPERNTALDSSGKT